MRHYRFCFLDALGRAASEQRVQANDDSEAVEFARLLMNGFGIEILEGDSRVAVILPEKVGIPFASLTFVERSGGIDRLAAPQT